VKAEEALDRLTGWFATCCGEADAILLLRCPRLAKSYEGYQQSPSRFREPMARQLFEHIAHARMALAASPPYDACKRLSMSSAAEGGVSSSDGQLWLAANQALDIARKVMNADASQQSPAPPSRDVETNVGWEQMPTASKDPTSTNSVPEDGMAAEGPPPTSFHPTGDDPLCHDAVRLRESQAHITDTLSADKRVDGSDTHAIQRWFTLSSAGEGLSGASCEGKPVPCKNAGRCIFCAYLAGRQTADGWDTKAVAIVIQDRFSEPAGHLVPLDVDGTNLLDIVVTLSKRLRDGKRIDKMVSIFGAVPVEVTRVALAAREGKLGRFYFTRRRNRVTREIQYGAHEDLGNYTYALWLTSVSPNQPSSN